MSILNRTVFYDTSGGLVRFLDWAQVTTTLGSMAEPFEINSRHGDVDIPNFDLSDEVNRIDNLLQIDVHQAALRLSGGDHALIGGTLMPRVGP